MLLQHDKFRLKLSLKDIKVIPGDKYVTQHLLLVSDLNLKINKGLKKAYVPKLRTEDIWKDLRSSILSNTEKVCGWSKKNNWWQQTW